VDTLYCLILLIVSGGEPLLEEGEDGLVEFDELSLLVHGGKVLGCCCCCWGDLSVTRDMTLLVVGLAT
jgi:hypothetical protein